MGNDHAKPLPGRSRDADETLESVDALAEHYEEQWQNHGPRPDLALFLPTVGQPHRRPALVRLVTIDLRQRIRRGDAARVEEYVERFVELGRAEALPCELIAAEYAARLAAGECPDVAEYARRFPTQIDRLRDEWLGDATGREPARPPAPLDLDPGARLGDFEIVRLLGRGGFARVYLARQCSLDRHVALKVSRAVGEEGRTLARLDHPHIVPVFSEQVVDGRKLLAMRYVPGRTLADWLAARGEIDPRRWRGRDLLAWIQQQLEASSASGVTSPQERFRAGRFAPTMARLVLGLARGLQHAHEQRVLHCDIKPANILLDVDGRALLMDFNVARQGSAGGSSRPLVGGTLSYMAPEHLGALLPAAAGLSRRVDERTDIFSLGVVFFELLAGYQPWPVAEAAVASPAHIRQMLARRLQEPPLVPSTVASAGLRSIVAKCLTPQADDRYPSAAALVDDLQRWLTNRPLVVAPDPSLPERFRKWFGRHPVGTTVLATLAVIAVAVWVAMIWSERLRMERAERLLTQAAVALAVDNPDQANNRVDAVRNTLAHRSAVPVPFVSARRAAAGVRLAALEQNIALAQMRRFQDLNDRRRAAPNRRGGEHAAAVDPLGVYHVLADARWEQRPALRNLGVQDRLQISQDITELLLIRAVALADRRVPNHPGTQPARRAASPIDPVTLLDRIPAIYEHVPLLVPLRDALAKTPPVPIPTAALARTADGFFAHYLVGAVAAQRGEYQLAIAQFDVSEASRPAGRPRRFWTQFLRAYCCERLGRLPEAIAGYGSCIGLRPGFAWSYHNLGLVYLKQGNAALAADQFERALRCAPTLAAAHANLGVAWFRRGRFADARAAFTRAIELGDRSADVLANRASARAALKDRAGAREDLERALAIDPQCRAARENLRRLEATR